MHYGCKTLKPHLWHHIEFPVPKGPVCVSALDFTTSALKLSLHLSFSRFKWQRWGTCISPIESRWFCTIWTLLTPIPASSCKMERGNCKYKKSKWLVQKLSSGAKNSCLYVVSSEHLHDQIRYASCLAPIFYNSFFSKLVFNHTFYGTATFINFSVSHFINFYQNQLKSDF